MKLCIYSDVHWNTYSSLIKSRGLNYSVRLEHLLNSINWVNEVASSYGCSATICAGDFFDKSIITDEEVTALSEIKWASIPHYFLCGNHESSINDLSFNSLKALESDNRYIISKPYLLDLDCVQVVFIPYIVESNRRPLIEYITELNPTKKFIIISHNDIKGIQYGGFESKNGFGLDEIAQCNTYYLNGHLHNSEKVSDFALNVGSLSAHNFTNDSTRYSYGLWLFDTDSGALDFIENPYGFNFYKFEIQTEKDLNKLNDIKNNSVLSIKCLDIYIDKLKEVLASKIDKIIENRIITVRSNSENVEHITNVAEFSVDHLQKFREFCLANIENSEIVQTELSEICK